MDDAQAAAANASPSLLRISIPTTVSDADGGTLYEIHCANVGSKWTTRRRYHEFRALLRELTDSPRHDKLELSFLPQLPKRYKGVKKRRPEVVASRRDSLQLFLRAATAIPGIATDPCFLRFIAFEETQHGHTHGAVRRMRQHTVAEMGHRMATLQRAGSAVLMADLVEDTTPPTIQGELLLRVHSAGRGNASPYKQCWCEMRGPAIFWYNQKGDEHAAGSYSFDAGSTVSNDIPSTVRCEQVDTLPHCLTIESADHYIILSVPKKTELSAWHAVILKEQGHREEAERALGIDAKRWTEQAGSKVAPKIEDIGAHIMAAYSAKEEEEKARRQARRQMFLMQHDDGKS